MSSEALDWAWKQDAPANEKFLLVAIADGASSRGVSIEGAPELAPKLGSGISTVRRNLARLEERGLLSRSARYDTENGGRLTNVLVLPLGNPPLDPASSPLSDRQVAPLSDRQASARERGTTSSSSDRAGDGQSVFEGLEPEMFDEEMWMDALEFLRTKRKVDGRIVSKRELSIATAALTAFNRAAGSSFGLGAHLTPIVMRVRERPSWEASKFVRLVESAWRIRWWERNGRGGRVTPQVVFGNARCFENVALDAAAEKAGRTDEIAKRKYDREVIR